jgi:hypothetical protein
MTRNLLSQSLFHAVALLATRLGDAIQPKGISQAKAACDSPGGSIDAY